MEKITTKTEIFKKGQKSYTSSNFFLKSSAYSSNLNSNQKSINTKKFNIFRPSNFTDQILKSINLTVCSKSWGLPASKI